MCTSPIALLRMQVVTTKIPNYRGFKKATYFSHIKGKLKTVWQLLIYRGLSMLLSRLSVLCHWLPSSWSRIGDRQSFHFPKSIREERLLREFHIYYLVSLSEVMGATWRPGIKFHSQSPLQLELLANGRRGKETCVTSRCVTKGSGSVALHLPFPLSGTMRSKVTRTHKGPLNQS